MVRRSIGRHVRNRYLAVLDVVGFGLSLLVAYAIRFETFSWPAGQSGTFARFLPIAVALKLLVFHRAGLYRRLWRYASVVESERIATAAGVAATLSIILGVWILPIAGVLTAGVPLSVATLDGLFTLIVAVGPRFYVRAATARGTGRPLHPHARRLLIAGAGSAGELIAKELRANPDLGLVPVGYVDDDRSKQGLELSGLPILGPVDRLAEYRERCQADEVIVAMPSATGATVRRVMQRAEAAGLRTKTIPGMFEILSGRVGISLCAMQIQDLLRRAPIRTDLAGRALVDRRPSGAGDGGRGIDRQRTLSAGGPVRARAPGRARARRELHLRDRGGTTEPVPRPARRSRDRRHPEPRPDPASSWSTTIRRWCSTRPRTSTCR